MATVISGSEVAKSLLESAKEKTRKLSGIKPKLAIIRVGERSDSIGYENATIRVMNSVGIDVVKYLYPSTTSNDKFLEEFRKINTDNSVDGILVLRPLPSHIDGLRISNEIDSTKDIDGMSPYNIGRTLSPSYDDFIPCTPQAVMETLKYYKIEIKSKSIVVIGNSLVVGSPLSILLMHLGATVTVCNIYTEDLKEHCSRADIVISATGCPRLVKREYVKEGVVLIDVGTSYDYEGNVQGDIDFDSLIDVASYITPVPGGIGTVTTAVLANRVVQSARRRTMR